jgi:hypothetical protein
MSKKVEDAIAKRENAKKPKVKEKKAEETSEPSGG